MMPR
jgi:hypothetical protein